MMTPTPFLIADGGIGLERDLEPWLLPNEAYPELEDAYVFRGRVKKKQGYFQLGRLKRNILNGAGSTSVILNQTTTAGATTTITDLLNDPNLIVTTGGSSIRTVISSAQIVPGSLSITIQTGVKFTDNGDGTLTSSQGTANNTVNYITGAITLKFNPGDPGTQTITVSLYYYPNLPVMGLRSLETTTLNQEFLIAFDTLFSYQFNTASKIFVDKSFYNTSPNPPNFTWSGADYQFFWTTNYASAMWATNNVAGHQTNPIATTSGKGDGIRWFDNSSSGWVNFLPKIDSTNYLQGALIILPYKGRLIVLNTQEGTDVGVSNKNYPQRARWCQNGTPYYTNTLPSNFNGSYDANSWRSDITGKGGFIDAPTSEFIVSAEFVKDTLVVYFENSTWQLRYNGNELLPFVWEKINTEFGATSTFSNIPFDRVVLGVGNVGIQACDSVGVQRIDQKIPDEVFAFQNTNQGRQRIYGVRDYYTQLVYWTVPYVGPDQQQGIDEEDSELPPPGVPLTYPNKILTYNYIDQTYSFFNDSFTCFGYYQKAADNLWSDTTTQWQATLFRWVAPESQQGFPYVVAGNQVGFVEIFDPNRILNDDSLYISAITSGDPTTTLTVPNHNLTIGTFIKFVNNPSGITGLQGIYKVQDVPNANTIVLNTPVAPTGTFTGSGTITVVSKINIITKKFNPYINEASQVRLHRIDFFFEATQNGSLQVNIYINDDTTDPTNITYNTVNTFPESTYQSSPDISLPNSKLWKRVQIHNISQFFQIQITMNDQQMMTDNIVESAITLHGMILYFSKSGRLIDV